MTRSSPLTARIRCSAATVTGSAPATARSWAGTHLFTHADSVAGSSVGFGSNDTVSSTTYNTVSGFATGSAPSPARRRRWSRSAASTTFDTTRLHLLSERECPDDREHHRYLAGDDGQRHRQHDHHPAGRHDHDSGRPDPGSADAGAVQAVSGSLRGVGYFTDPAVVGTEWRADRDGPRAISFAIGSVDRTVPAAERLRAPFVGAAEHDCNRRQRRSLCERRR